MQKLVPVSGKTLIEDKFADYAEKSSEFERVTSFDESGEIVPELVEDLEEIMDLLEMISVERCDDKKTCSELYCGRT